MSEERITVTLSLLDMNPTTRRVMGYELPIYGENPNRGHTFYLPNTPESKELINTLMELVLGRLAVNKMQVAYPPQVVTIKSPNLI